MNIYLLTQNDNNDYDTYDSCIVCAKDAKDAKTIDPRGELFVSPKNRHPSWAFSLKSITCEEIGIANRKQKRGVILSSFNAG